MAMNKENFTSYISENPPRVPDTDRATRWGIPVLVILLFAIIGFFFGYNNRTHSVTGASSQASGASEGFFSQLFSTSTDTPAKNIDSDGDGLSDTEETAARTNPQLPDSDNDGLNDREEVKVYKTDPLKSDSDGDGMSDSEEIKSRRNPSDPNPASEWPPRPAALSSN